MSDTIDELRQKIVEKEKASTPSFLDRPDRLAQSKEYLKFYPQSNQEMTTIMGLVGRSELPFPTLAYLDDIARHQYSAKANAHQTVESIIRGFASFGGNAVNERAYMETFLQQAKTIEFSNLTGFNTVFPVSAWENDGNQRAAFTTMARYVEIDAFAHSEGDDTLLKSGKIDDLKHDARIERITETLGVLRIGQMEQIAHTIIHDQERRLDYWTARLQDAQQHLFARADASEALVTLRLISE